jgi:hypothetical protein
VTLRVLQSVFAASATFEEGLKRVRSAYLPSDYGPLDILAKRRYHFCTSIDSMVLAAAASAGGPQHCESVLAILGGPRRCDPLAAPAQDRLTKAASAAYDACADRGNLRGADMMAPLLCATQWLNPFYRAVSSDHHFAIAAAVRLARRQARRSPDSQNVLRFVDSELWAHTLESGSPCTARVLVDLGVPVDDVMMAVDEAFEYEPDDDAPDVKTAFGHDVEMHERWHFPTDLLTRGSVRCDSYPPVNVVMRDACRVMRWAIRAACLPVCIWLSRCYGYGRDRAWAFGPLPIGDAIALALRSNTYHEIALWLCPYIGEGLERCQVVAALKGASALPTRSEQIEFFFEDWADAILAIDQDGDLVLGHLFCRPLWTTASILCRASLPWGGVILADGDGLWRRHVARLEARIARGANVQAALEALCKTARRCNLITDEHIAARAALVGGRDTPRARALLSLQNITPDTNVWGPWMGTVAPISRATLDASIACANSRSLAACVERRDHKRQRVDSGARELPALAHDGKEAGREALVELAQLLTCAGLASA